MTTTSFLSLSLVGLVYWCCFLKKSYYYCYCCYRPNPPKMKLPKLPAAAKVSIEGGASKRDLARLHTQQDYKMHWGIFSARYRKLRQTCLPAKQQPAFEAVAETPSSVVVPWSSTVTLLSCCGWRGEPQSNRSAVHTDLQKVDLSFSSRWGITCRNSMLVTSCFLATALYEMWKALRYE